MESSIDDFEILNKLGSGSFSDVYKVKRKSDGMIYAMKKIKMSLLNSKEKENALNEIRILASFSSNNLIQYKDSFIDSDANILCIIMELASEGDLNKLIESSRLKGGVEECEIWNALVQITVGLKILHDKKILHRDLKGANIFVSEKNERKIYKIGDLNISKVTQQGKANTQTGTPYYAAPEVWRGETYSSSCDIWSLGCILYELASCRPPFRANDIKGLNEKIQKGYYDPLPPKYSKELAAIISTMLRTNHTARPNCLQILQNPIVIQKSGQVLINAEDSITGYDQLLQTIKLPQNLKELKSVLPKAKYSEITNKTRAISLTERNTIQKSTPILKNPIKNQPQNKPPHPSKPPINMKGSQNNNPTIPKNDKPFIPVPQTPQMISRNNPRMNSPSQKQIQNAIYPKQNFTPKGMGKRQFSAQNMSRR